MGISIKPVSSPLAAAVADPNDVPEDAQPVKDPVTALGGWLASRLKNALSTPTTLASVDKTLTTSNGSLGYSAKLGTRVALDPDDALVSGNTLRADAAQNGVVWTEMNLDAGVHGSGTVPGFLAGLAVPNLSAGADFGFDTTQSARAIVPADREISLRAVGQGIGHPARALELVLDPDKLAANPPAPGTEYTFEGKSSADGDVTVGLSQLATLGAVDTGAAAAASTATTYKKSVQFLGTDPGGRVSGNWVSVEVTREAQRSGQLSAHAAVLGAPPQSTAAQLGVKTLLGGKLSASAAATLSGERDLGFQLGGLFNLETAEGRKGFAKLAQTPPAQLEQSTSQVRSELLSMGSGVAVLKDKRTRAVQAELTVGDTTWLAFSDTRTNSKGSVLKAQNGNVEEEQVADLSRERSVKGLLPTLFSGEERTASFGFGDMVDAKGNESRGLVMDLSVASPKLSGPEQRAWQRYAKGMGVEGADEAKPTTTNGKATLDFRVAVTGEQAKALEARSAADLKLAFDASYLEMEGRPPPWNDTALAKQNPHYRSTRMMPPNPVQKELSDAKYVYEQAQTFHDLTAAQQASDDYRATTGRDLARDLALFDAREKFCTEVANAGGKPPDQWNKVASQVVKHGSQVVRLEALTLKKAAGAQLVSLELNANGVKLSKVNTEVELPPTAEQETAYVPSPSAISDVPVAAAPPALGPAEEYRYDDFGTIIGKQQKTG